MDPQVTYLLSLGAIRERAKIVGEAAKAGKLSHFDVHEDRLDDVADFVTSVINVRLWKGSDQTTPYSYRKRLNISTSVTSGRTSSRSSTS